MERLSPDFENSPIKLPPSISLPWLLSVGPHRPKLSALQVLLLSVSTLLAPTRLCVLQGQLSFSDSFLNPKCLARGPNGVGIESMFPPSLHSSLPPLLVPQASAESAVLHTPHKAFPVSWTSPSTLHTGDHVIVCYNLLNVCLLTLYSSVGQRLHLWHSRAKYLWLTSYSVKYKQLLSEYKI